VTSTSGPGINGLLTAPDWLSLNENDWQFFSPKYVSPVDPKRSSASGTTQSSTTISAVNSSSSGGVGGSNTAAAARRIPPQTAAHK
jgi:hypothetical protein